MTKPEILEHALLLFMNKGYEGASMSDLAAATGIKKASLYAHYSGKEEIFSAVFTGVVEEYRENMKTLLLHRAEESALTRLERMFRAFLRYCHNNPRMYFWDRYFYFPPEFIKERMERETKQTQDEFLQVIQAAISEGIASGEISPQPVESAALAYYYLMIGLSMSVKLYDREALEHDISLAWAGLAQGLKKET
ncbi:MAG: TetR/AcrR family transcriptional regulator [Eubacteriales bacterium]|nr:TetR/AcrR family transcriptional regulator [Eubacteriales bacterium]